MPYVLEKIFDCRLVVVDAIQRHFCELQKLGIYDAGSSAAGMKTIDRDISITCPEIVYLKSRYSPLTESLTVKVSYFEGSRDNKEI